MNRFLGACGLLTLCTTLLLGQQPRGDRAPPQGSEPMELVFFRERAPLLLRIHVLQGGQALQVHWQQYLERWFNYLDRNQRGAIDQVALFGAPKAASMRSLQLTGTFFPNANTSLNLYNDFMKGTDQTVTRIEFLDYYRKQQAGPIQTTAAPSETASQANDTLFKLLDRNGDGKLSRAEVESAKDLLALRDANDDELVSAAELSPGAAPTPVGIAFVRQPNLIPVLLQGRSFYHINSDQARAGLAALLLAHYDKDKNTCLSREEIGLEPAPFAALDKNTDGALDLEELTAWPRRAPAVELSINLRGGNQAAPVVVISNGPLPATSLRNNSGALAIALGDADIAVQNLDSGSVARVAFNQSAFLLQQIKAADTKNRGYVELKDLQGPNLQFIRTLFPVLDRNEDEKLTEQELTTYFKLQEQVREVSTTFYVQEQGRNWFQLVDTNNDGYLSPRELLSAWQRLAVHDKNGDGVIDAAELPMQFRVVFNPVAPQQFVVATSGLGTMAPGREPSYPAQTPLWFRKMDRNRDGDVSRREFLGAREDFDRLDRNGDNLVDAGEAAAAK